MLSRVLACVTDSQKWLPLVVTPSLASDRIPDFLFNPYAKGTEF